MAQTGKGAVVVSTKASAPGRKLFLLIMSAVGIAAAIYVMADSKEMANAFGGGSTGNLIVWVLAIGVLAGCGFMAVATFLGGKSYCDVCERGVVGRTALDTNDRSAPMQDFNLDYDEISNVTESGKFIIIYTSYAKYTVLALKNRSEAAREIRKRIAK